MARRHRAYGFEGESEARLNDEFEALQDEKEDVAKRVLTRAPVARDIPDRGIIFALVSGTLRLYTKYQNDLYYVDLTKV